MDQHETAVAMRHEAGGETSKRSVTIADAASAPRLDSKDQVLICFSHLRWHFVFQRPQHLMTRFARTMRVFYVEEPFFGETSEPILERHPTGSGVTILVARRD